MRKVTKAQLLEQCKLWRISTPSDREIADAKKKDSYVAIEILGLYYPKRGELWPWRITPSSEDKGYCSS